MKPLSFVACLAMSALIGCSNPRQQKLPDDLAQAESDPKFQAAVKKLTPEEQKDLAFFVSWHLKRGEKPTQKTVGEAIAATRALNEEIKAEVQKAKELDAAYASLPPAQAEFCKTVNGFQEEYAGAKARKENQLKLSQLRTERRAAIVEALAGKGDVTGWVGTVKRLRTDSGGNASVQVVLACAHPVKLSNVKHIPREAPVYASFADLAVGRRVAVSGSFVPSGEDGVHELSLTEAGSMTDPDFHFEFAAAAPAGASDGGN